MRPLMISDENRAAAQKVVEFASKPENWYRPGVSTFVPGDRPEYTVCLDTFRCVYTVTYAQEQFLRHLSISVGGNKLPNKMAAYTIATWFGFTGAVIVDDVAVKPGADWMVGLAEGDPVTAGMLLQPFDGPQEPPVN